MADRNTDALQCKPHASHRTGMSLARLPTAELLKSRHVKELALADHLTPLCIQQDSQFTQANTSNV
jgi:hypothetical protein